MSRVPRRLLLALLLLPASARAAELLVQVRGIDEPRGEIGCSLFAGSAGFLADGGAAQVLWVPAKGKDATCRFDGLKAGAYAVAVAHDSNGNHEMDTNFIGIPVEQWGVSNNIRPTFRAPRFEESSFKIAGADDRVVIEIVLGE